MESKLRTISLGATLVIGTPLLLSVPSLSQLGVIYKTLLFSISLLTTEVILQLETYELYSTCLVTLRLCPDRSTEGTGLLRVTLLRGTDHVSGFDSEQRRGAKC